MELALRLEAEDACVWGAWAGALVVAVAACVAGEELAAVLRQPGRTGRPERIVLQRGHVVGIGGGSFPQLIRLAGAEPVEVGAVDTCGADLVAAALDGEAAAGLFAPVAGAAPDLLSMPAFVWACHAAGKPVVVALRGLGGAIAALDAGADLVVLEGEAGSGVIAGRADLVRACRLQARGIGRAFTAPDPASPEASMSQQLLHLVLGGELKDSEGTEFVDPSAIDLVGIYPSYAEAVKAWRGKAQATIDSAQTRYFVVHLHRLLEPKLEEGKG